MIISNIICYFVFYGKYSMTVVGLVIVLGKWLLEAIVPKFKGKSFEGDLSAWIVYNNLDKKDKILIFK